MSSVVYKRLQPGDAARCSYCRLPFDGCGVPIVESYDPGPRTYEAYRSACTPACAKSFIAASGGDGAARRLLWQRQLLVEEFGWPCDKPIPLARPWEELVEFGGTLGVDEWRRTAGCVRSRVVPASVVPHQVLTEVLRAGESRSDGGEGLDFGDDALESMSTVGLRRPQEDHCIKTIEQLQAAFPDFEVVSRSEGEFAKFLRNDELPSDARCAELRAELTAEKKAQRKRRANGAAAAASRPKRNRAA
jgi:hypothetical protein